MSFLAFTAPRFTLEEREREREGLTAEELACINVDVYGLSESDSVEETDAVVDIAVGRMNEAIELAPDSEKAAYLQAQREAPDLVQQESNPLWFLRCEGFDPWASSARLLKYWKTRQGIFKDRAFLPMTLTGAGAMTDADIQSLSNPGLMFLPPDEKNRPILFYERARYYSTPERSIRVTRAAFYILTTRIAGDPACQRNGWLGLAYSVSTRSEYFDRRTLRWMREMSNSVPARLRAVHDICKPNDSFYSYVMPMMLWLLGKEMRQRYIIHLHTEPDDIVASLAQYGISAASIPSWVGGTYDPALHREWIATQLGR